MKPIGLIFPFFLLLIFAIAFHPSMQIHLLEFTHPWEYVFFSPQMFFLLATILILSKNRIPPNQVGITLQPLKKNVILGIGVGLVPYLLMTIANMALSKGQPVNNNEIQFQWNSYMIFSFFIFAPLSEEMFFRGIIFHALKESYAVNTAIIASAFLFSASHSTMMAGPFALGIIAAVLTQKTKSILPGILFHALSNGLPWYYTNHCPNLLPFEKWIFFHF